MTKALLWKEWREQRIIAAAGLIVGMILPVVAFVILSSTPRAVLSDLADISPLLLGLLVWPLFAVLTGASAISDPADGGALGFLLSRPVSLSRVWAIKVSTAALALLSIVAGSLAFAFLLDVGVTGGHGFALLLGTAPPDSLGLLNPAIRITLLMLPGLGLACGAFFATFSRRPLTAAIAAGVATTIAVWAGFVAAGLIAGEDRLDRGSARFFAPYFLMLTAIFLTASWFLFRRRVMLPGASARRLVPATVAGVLAAAVLATHAVAAMATRPVAAERPVVAAILPDGGGIVLRMQRDDFTGEFLWLAQPGQEARPLTGRRAHAPTVGPDGEWMTYHSNLDRFGWRRERCELRLTSIAGGVDRRLVDDVACGQAAVFSPDGAKIAVSTAQGLAVAELAADEQPRSFDTPSRFGDPLTFTVDSTGVVWRAIGEWDGADEIVLIDLTTGRTTPVFADPRASRVYAPAVTPRHLVVDPRYAARGAATARWRDGRDLVLVELTTGVFSPLPGSCPTPSFAVAFVDRGEKLVYSDCGGGGDDGDIVVRELESGAESVLASFAWPVFVVAESPTGNTLRVSVRDVSEDGSAGRYRHFAVTLDGTSTPLEISPGPSWSDYRWLDDDHLLLSRLSNRRRSYARFNYRSGEVQPFGEAQ